jgi:hypothetical protein
MKTLKVFDGILIHRAGPVAWIHLNQWVGLNVKGLEDIPSISWELRSKGEAKAFVAAAKANLDAVLQKLCREFDKAEKDPVFGITAAAGEPARISSGSGRVIDRGGPTEIVPAIRIGKPQGTSQREGD